VTALGVRFSVVLISFADSLALFYSLFFVRSLTDPGVVYAWTAVVLHMAEDGRFEYYTLHFSTADFYEGKC
jgi:hypothetical protein